MLTSVARVKAMRNALAHNHSWTELRQCKFEESRTVQVLLSSIWDDVDRRLINVYSQKLIDLLDDTCNRFGVEHETLVYYQSLIQCVRAGASQDIVSFMNDVELTEEWLFERLRVNEERKLRDPEDAYLEVQRQEAERAEKGLPPRVQFQKDADEDTKPDDGD